MTGTVSTASLVGMVFTIFVSFGLPIAAAIFAKRKLKAKMLPILIGAGTFVVFALILESALHLTMQNVFGEQLLGNVWFYALYGGLAAGLFEETGRFLAMKLLMKKTLCKENAIMYGVGHGGIESIMVVGLSYISNLILSFMINGGQLEAILSGVEEPLRTEVEAQLSTLWTTPALDFYLAGVERAAAFVLQLCLSYLVYRAVREGKAVFYILAMTIHFAVDAGTVLLMQVLPIYAVEAILVVVIVVFLVVVVKEYKKEAAPVGDGER